VDTPDEVAKEALTRAVQAHALVGEHTQMASEASRQRREAIETLIAAGMPQVEIAAHLGISRVRVSQLLRSGPSPERALLSVDGGRVTVALGSKQAQVGDGNPNAMISDAAAEAYDTIRAALDQWKVECAREVVPAPGLIDLNRDHLIVLGSPKVLPTVGQIMGSDPNLVFGADDQGRYLADRTSGTRYHSPQDRGEPTDYAYVGRLPRPDGRGHFLWLAGIHALGTLGAARYLVDNAPELYRSVKDRLFSVLVESNCDPTTRSITSTATLTKIFIR
jgi:hypothetical protein